MNPNAAFAVRVLAAHQSTKRVLNETWPLPKPGAAAPAYEIPAPWGRPEPFFNRRSIICVLIGLPIWIWVWTAGF